MKIKLSIMALIFCSFNAFGIGSIQIRNEDMQAINIDTNGSLSVQFVNENGNGLGVDLITRSLMTVDYAHHEIHAGSTFRVQANDDAIAATGSDGELVLGFYVPDQSKEPHMLWDFVHEGDMTMKLIEGVTLTLGTGTDVSCKNSNRNSDNTSVLQGIATSNLVSGYVTSGCTYTNGTVISLKRSYAAKNMAASGTRRNEVVLKPDTYYVFVLDNNETSTQGGQIRLEWYEHTPKEN